ncbi:MAG: hypothetical protein KKF44_06920 [Nanoarchaeota archaeon]|nr:hypothetical protein [Nanoarchaeota archaeon]
MIKNKNVFLVQTFRSRYCIMVFLIGMLLSYFLVPRMLFHTHLLLALVFMAVFSTVLACSVRIAKERIINTRVAGTGLLSVIAMGIGFSALHVCGVGAPVCGATVGLGVMSLFLPTAASQVIEKYSIHIILISIIFQLVSLYFMNCFKTSNTNCG